MKNGGENDDDKVARLRCAPLQVARASPYDFFCFFFCCICARVSVRFFCFFLLYMRARGYIIIVVVVAAAARGYIIRGNSETNIARRSREKGNHEVTRTAAELAATTTTAGCVCVCLCVWTSRHSSAAAARQ